MTSQKEGTAQPSSAGGPLNECFTSPCSQPVQDYGTTRTPEIQQPILAFDRQAAVDYLTKVMVDRPGWMNIASPVDWSGRCFPTTSDGVRAAVDYAEWLDKREAEGIYYRLTTLLTPPAPGKRGESTDSADVSFLGADLDFGNIGHGAVNLPPTEVDAYALIAEAGLPDPSFVVRSGGGLHAFWKLTEPVTVAVGKQRGQGVNEALESAAERHGWHVDAVSADMARVYRLPGSINRKVPGNPRRCYVVGGTGQPVELASLPLGPVVVPPPRTPSSNPGGGGGPFDALAASVTWSDVLEPAGWSLVKVESSGAELWLRPGDATSQYSARCFEHNMVVFSEAAGLPTGAGQALTKGRVFAHLHHDGDESAAARDLLDAAAGVGGSEAARGLPDHVLEAIKAAGADRDAEQWAKLGIDIRAVAARAPVAKETPHDGQGDTGQDQDAEVLPSPNNPLAVVRHLQPEFTLDDLTTRHHWRGAFHDYQGPKWVEKEDDEVRAWWYTRTEHAHYMKVTKTSLELVPFAPTKAKVTNLLDAQAAVTHLPGAISPPCWLSSREDMGPIVSCANGLLVVRTRELLAHTPAYFNHVSVPFDYEPGSSSPTRWLTFLDEVFEADAESIALLQEWAGYILSGRTDLHKILLVIGPTRSGKSTIGRVLAGLLGIENVANPTLASLGTQFGLDPLRDKSLGLISDARLANRDNPTVVVERLLSISGEDPLTVDRKYRAAWHGKVPARLMILSNELPRFTDSSGAIAGRLLILHTPNSWLGREDSGLTGTLLAELPGILNWSLEGLDRLDKRGRFVPPAASADAVHDLKELVSPVSAFVAEKCEPSGQVSRAQLFAQWRMWAEQNGHHAGSIDTFGRDLRAAVPGLQTVRPRGQGRLYSGISLREGVPPVPVTPGG